MINETYIKLLKTFDEKGGEKAFEKQPTKLLTDLRDAIKIMLRTMSSQDIIDSIRKYRTNDK